MTEARVINIDTIYTRERTMKLGMTCNDRDENIRSGFIVYSSCYPKDKDHNFVRVLDMEGNQVHQWDMGNKMPGLWSYIPNPECISRYVKPNQKGCLFAITKIPPAVTVKQDFIAWEADRGGLMELIDFDGNIIWSYADEQQNHDACITKEGHIIYIASEVVQDAKKAQRVIEIASRRRGFTQVPKNKKVYADVIKVVDPISRKILFEWHAAEYLDPEIDVISFNDNFDEWTHANTVFPLYENRNNPTKLTGIIVCFRHISTVGRIDIETSLFQRLLTSPFVSQPHDCSSLVEYNTDRLLVFNNRFCANDFAPSPFSTVLEYDMTRAAPCKFLPQVTGPKVAWKYVEGILDLFSGYISGVQRLPGYNLEEHGVQYTLITEGSKGRLLIVKTTMGEEIEGEPVLQNKVVWEFMNPEMAPGYDVEELILGRNAVYKARYVLPDIFSPEQLEQMSANRPPQSKL